MVKVKSAIHQAGAYLWFLRDDATGNISTPPGRGASPLQGYLQHYVCLYPFIYLGGERHCEN